MFGSIKSSKDERSRLYGRPMPCYNFFFVITIIIVTAALLCNEMITS